VFRHFAQLGFFDLIQPIFLALQEIFHLFCPFCFPLILTYGLEFHFFRINFRLRFRGSSTIPDFLPEFDATELFPQYFLESEGRKSQKRRIFDQLSERIGVNTITPPNRT